jgi:hypothetical protein
MSSLFTSTLDKPDYLLLDRTALSDDGSRNELLIIPETESNKFNPNPKPNRNELLIISETESNTLNSVIKAQNKSESEKDVQNTYNKENKEQQNPNPNSNSNDKGNRIQKPKAQKYIKKSNNFLSVIFEELHDLCDKSSFPHPNPNPNPNPDLCDKSSFTSAADDDSTSASSRTTVKNNKETKSLAGKFLQPAGQ